MGSHQTCHRLTAQSALRVDCMNAEQTGERTGSRPKPPKAGARSASLEPDRSSVYLSQHSCSVRFADTSPREAWGGKECEMSLERTELVQLGLAGPREEASLN